MSNLPPIVVVDWRCLVKNMSHSIRSGSIPCAFPTEPEEISHRIMKRLYCLKADHPDTQIFLANDVKPYWRESYMAKWYSKHGLEPVRYKGNRTKSSWLFQTSQSDMEALYTLLLEQGAMSIGATVVQDRGLEADDIWGIISKGYGGPVTGYTTDTDWAQLVSDKVKVKSLATGEMIPFHDIRIKWIGGDPGDTIPGVPKPLKNGAPSTKNYGHTGAEKLLQQDDWESQVDPDHLERNKRLTTLPCPTWNLEESLANLSDCAVHYPETDAFWDRYGVTLPIRKMLEGKAQREAWMKRLRLHILATKEA